MTLVQPHGTVVLPTAIKGQPNGAVDPALLNWVEEGNKALVYLMADLPARSMRAWHADAFKRGIVLFTTGRGRTLAQQWQIFGGSQARYRPTSVAEWSTTPTASRKNPWLTADRNAVAADLGITIPNSAYWIKIDSKLATAATPGTSNHGYWCADDLAEIIGGHLVGLSPSTLQYLYGSGARFGFTWETASEDWHVCWMMGDVLPQAVLDYENPSTPPPTPPGPVYDEDMPTLYQDSRYKNVFLVNGDVTTVGPNLFNSLAFRGVPVVTDVHDQSLISFMRKAQIKMSQLVASGTPDLPPFNPPPDLQG